MAAAKRAAGTDLTGLFDRVCTVPAPRRAGRRPGAAGVPGRPNDPPGTPSRRRCSTTSISSARPSIRRGPSRRQRASSSSTPSSTTRSRTKWSADSRSSGSIRRPSNTRSSATGISTTRAAPSICRIISARASSCPQADWDLLEKSNQPKPKRDMVATDGMKLTLGDTTLTLYITPGHTLGTISTLIPVKDNGTPHLVAEWGGTAFNWMANRAAYITPERPDRFWFETYSKSARAIQGHRGQGGRRRHHRESHQLRWLEDEDSAAGGAQAGRAESLRHRQGGRAALHDHRRRMRKGGTRAARQVSGNGAHSNGRWPRKHESTKFSPSSGLRSTAAGIRIAGAGLERSAVA